MKTLYFFRHAKSSWEDSQLHDFDRPLNERGRRDAPRMGQILSQKQPKPAHWISSPARRAWDTAALVAQQLGVAVDDINRIAELYEASPDEILHVIRSQPDSAQSMIVFGHNPGLTEIASALCNYDFENIPTSGIACIRFAAERWQEIGPITGELVFFEYPKKAQSS